MQVSITQAMKDALTTVHDVPDTIRARFDAIMADGQGGFTITLSDDDATALAELVQWHIKTDPATGKPTKDTAPFDELIRRIDAAMF